MQADLGMEFPYDIKDVDSEVSAQRQKYYTGLNSQFVRVGPKGYFMSMRYKNDAQNIYTMPLRDTDVFVGGYPRSGTTLTQELVWLIANNLDYEQAHAISQRVRIPLLEFNDSTISHDSAIYAGAQSPRFMKTHLPLSLLPPHLLDFAKMVYVTRDPRDVAVSFYYLSKILKHQVFTGDFKTYWNYFIKDMEFWTPYFEHLKEAWQKRDHANMLFLFYEEMLKDLPAAVRQVSDFFNKKFSDEQVAELCEHLSFEKFKNNKSVNIEKMRMVLVDEPKDDYFIRKGKVGDWKNHFDEEMKEQAQRWMADNLRDSDFRFPHLENGIF